MTRTARSKKRLDEICRRFVTLVDNYLRMPDGELARRLGYPSGSTLWKVRRAQSFIDVDRLYHLSRIEVGGLRPNLDWLLTGDGDPMLSKEAPKAVLAHASAALAALSPQEQNAMLMILG